MALSAEHADNIVIEHARIIFDISDFIIDLLFPITLTKKARLILLRQREYGVDIVFYKIDGAGVDTRDAKALKMIAFT
ncbi:MAG: hypothetical protein DHS20C05_16740 [Hyphococcus sp.]|nr:MAG: hypothetical protein DHS20C05_16740 [Marinicaulis sp.]